MRAKAAGLRIFVVSRGNCRHLAAPFSKKLQGEVSEAADADDRNSVGRLHAIPHDRGEDRSTSAKQGTRVLRGDCIRNRMSKLPVLGADDRAEAARMSAHDRANDVRADVLSTAFAKFALHARPAERADADPITDLEPRDVRPNSRDDADVLMTRNDRVLRDTPLVVNHGDIGVTDARMRDTDIDGLRPKGNCLEIIRLERRTLGLGGVGVDVHRFDSPNGLVVSAVLARYYLGERAVRSFNLEKPKRTMPSLPAALPIIPNALETYRLEMVALLERLNPIEGIRASAVDGITFFRTRSSTPRVPVLYEPCIVVVAQGRKRLHLEDRVLTYDEGNFLVLSVPTPAGCETEVKGERPFLAVCARIDLETVGELVVAIGTAMEHAPTVHGARETAVSSPPLTLEVADVTTRLLRCLTSPIEAQVLGPQLVRELTYRVLCSPDGQALRSLLAANSAHARVHMILYRMHAEFSTPLNIAALAAEAGISVSSLHEHFKAVTGTSPLQYLKNIRLFKARTLMVQDALAASVVAARVGYESASQFNRDFKRLFGAPPAVEAERLRQTFGLGANA